MINSLGELWAPVAVPMGWKNACGLAQAHTWASTLFREKDEAPLGVYDCDVAGVYRIRHVICTLKLSIGKGVTPCTIVGAIFVLFDGVSVVTKDRDLRGRWNARLERNEAKFALTRKVPKILVENDQLSLRESSS